MTTTDHLTITCPPAQIDGLNRRLEPIMGPGVFRPWWKGDPETPPDRRPDLGICSVPLDSAPRLDGTRPPVAAMLTELAEARDDTTAPDRTAEVVLSIGRPAATVAKLPKPAPTREVP